MGNQIVGMTFFTPSKSASESEQVHEHKQRSSSPQEMFPGFNISGEHSHEKPCRACTDFKTWAKFHKERKDKEAGNKEQSTNLSATGSAADNEEAADADLEALLAERARMQCPLDKDELGKSTWSLLHTMAAYFPDKPTPVQKKEMSAFVKIFAKYYPCEHCAQDFQRSIKTSPPETSSGEQFSVWLCKMHNEVNRKLGKPEFDCRKINERWKEGWDDGSCDV